MPLSNKSIVSSLLSAAAGSLLVAHSASASIVTYNESSATGADFSNTFAGANVLSGKQQVFGDMDAAGFDPDFFKLSNLTPSNTFSLAINYSNTARAASSFTIRDDNQANIGSSVFTPALSGSSSGTITGTVPTSGNLIVDLQQIGNEVSGSSYDVTLSTVPEPAPVTVLLLGAAFAALALRRPKKES